MTLIITLIAGVFIISRNAFNCGYREGLVISWLIYFLFVNVSTEILSLFNHLEVVWLYSVYVTTTAALCAIALIQLKKKQWIYWNLPSFNSYKYLILILICGIAGFVAIYAAPNNWDSMTYNLARVMHWIQNKNVDFFPTHISRQLFNPPLSEYVMTHFYILSNGDQFVNMVQYISYLQSIIVVSLITRELKYNFRIQLSAAIVSATIPMAILQASNTKNELTLTFFVLSAFWFLIRYFANYIPRNLILASLATGCALLTKGTALIYLLPCIGLWLLLNLTKKPIRAIVAGSSIVIIAFYICSVFYYRNFNSYGHIFGADENFRNYIKNDKMDGKRALSNIVRNTAIHLGNVKLFDNSIFKDQSNIVTNSVLDIHSSLGINVNDPSTTWGGTVFSLAPTRDEDYAGNFLHILLFVIAFLVSMLYLRDPIKNMRRLAYMIAVLLSYLFFCVYLRWQPWHSRLHVPFFFLSVPVICRLMENKISDILIIGLLALGSIAYVTENDTRTILFKGPRITEHTRDEVMFMKKSFRTAKEHLKMVKIIENEHADTVGLILNGDGWDYPVWHMIKRVRPDIHIEHIMVSIYDTPQKILTASPVIIPKIIISTESNHSDTIQTNGRNYLNIKKFNSMDIYRRM